MYNFSQQNKQYNSDLMAGDLARDGSSQCSTHSDYQLCRSRLDIFGYRFTEKEKWPRFARRMRKMKGIFYFLIIFLHLLPLVN